MYFSEWLYQLYSGDILGGDLVIIARTDADIDKASVSPSCIDNLDEYTTIGEAILKKIRDSTEIHHRSILKYGIRKIQTHFVMLMQSMAKKILREHVDV